MSLEGSGSVEVVREVLVFEGGFGGGYLRKEDRSDDTRSVLTRARGSTITRKKRQGSWPAFLQFEHGPPFPGSPLHRILRLRQRLHFGVWPRSQHS